MRINNRSGNCKKDSAWASQGRSQLFVQVGNVPLVSSLATVKVSTFTAVQAP